MTTKLRRITIALPPQVDEAVLALAKVENRPQAKVIIEILAEFAPTMLAMARVQQQLAEGKKQNAKETIRHLFGDQMAGLLAEQVDLFKDKPQRKPRLPKLGPAKVQAYADTNGIPPGGQK